MAGEPTTILPDVTTISASIVTKATPSGGEYQTIYKNGRPFSNPLYFKTILVPFMVVWPLAVLCLIIYIYNLVNYKHSKVTMKMVFFPVLLFAGIIDNFYDLITKASIDEYNSTTLILLTGVFGALAVISITYLISYTKESLQANRYAPLIQDDEDDIVLFSRDEDAENIQLSMRSPNHDRWNRIIDEYITANVIWGLTTYNVMITLIYAARYITHTDHNYIREEDVAFVSAAHLLLLGIFAVCDFFLFKTPSCGSVFMHYAISAVFALNFTLDFFNQVKYCEILTLVSFFLSVFLSVYKLKLFIDIGVPAGKKVN